MIRQCTQAERAPYAGNGSVCAGDGSDGGPVLYGQHPQPNPPPTTAGIRALGMLLPVKI